MRCLTVGILALRIDCGETSWSVGVGWIEIAWDHRREFFFFRDSNLLAGTTCSKGLNPGTPDGLEEPYYSSSVFICQMVGK